MLGVIHQDAKNERKANAHGKRNRHSGDIDRRNKQNVCEIENRSAEQRRVNAGMRNLLEVRQERPSSGALAAQREAQYQGQKQNTDRVIPIEKLKPPAFARQFLRVRPRTPAKHRNYAEDDGPRITLQNEHFRSLRIDGDNQQFNLSWDGASRPEGFNRECVRGFALAASSRL